MERFILNNLIEWKNSKYRKPLILKGVRQVGKTWILKEFGKNYYKNFVYFNFDENIEYLQFFQTTKDPRRILQNLMLISGEKIEAENTLVIFDEIQDAPEVINSLKYFYENIPEFHIACAGSLLGIALAKPSSFPVGKVDFLSINPMTFSEFLIANGDQNLKSYLDSVNSIENIPDAFFNPLCEKLKMYYLTGGMPEAVYIWTHERNTELMLKSLNNIIEAYEKDFAKHPNIKEFPKISMIWKSIPSQLSRENKKFIYKVVKEGARAREYEDALQWLVDANLVNKIYRSSAPKLPLSAYDDLSAFKIYLVDVGLLNRLSLLSSSAFAEGNRLFTEFKGALTENYILESLENQFETKARYWTDNIYEVDFLIQHENQVIPIEVKAGINLKSRSLKKFTENYKDEVKLKIRFSLDNLKLDDDILNIPIFMADYTKYLISLVLKKI
ncbi:ATP-binding protein [Fusobacterium gastrosuis]|uniref:ATP-binding protein n=1 Tax=Fusobacterium gastrosuis TaxID=1755100 RepID=UPI002975E29C|nr:ATP-binding protein [Fusobacteriaceae bacterium]MDY5713204.1 ATP-binding protein [Fusobacterium gastrosuis]